jgi:hypothetical protein
VNLGFWLLGGVTFVVHGLIFNHFLVDIPFSSDWTDLTAARGFSRELSWQWLFSTQNNHPRLLHTFLMWVNLALTDGDYTALMRFNFACYVMGSAAILISLQRRFAIGLGFVFALLASTKSCENLFWANQSSFFQFIFFTYFGLALSLRPTWASLWSLPCIVLAFFSTASGYGAGLLYLTLNTFLAARTWRESLRLQAIKHVVQAALVAAVAVAWFKLGAFDNSVEQLTMPWTLLFWQGFFNIFSHGFGYDTVVSLPGLVLFGGLVTGCFAMLRSSMHARAEQDAFLFLTAFMGCLLFAVCAVSAGRMALGLEFSKSLRYTMYTQFLVPVFWIFFVRLAGSFKPRFGKAVLVSGFLACTVSFIDDLNWVKYYRAENADRRAIADVVQHYYQGRPAEHVRGSPHAEDLGERLRYAEGLGMGFVRF